ncbi:MAG: hypothetical protein JWM20_856 [Patescibacteria group bacterium]|nr:hypothetical protein [Patescibacteria group bacterium]
MFIATALIGLCLASCTQSQKQDQTAETKPACDCKEKSWTQDGIEYSQVCLENCKSEVDKEQFDTLVKNGVSVYMHRKWVYGDTAWAAWYIDQVEGKNVTITPQSDQDLRREHIRNAHKDGDLVDVSFWGDSLAGPKHWNGGYFKIRVYKNRFEIPCVDHNMYPDLSVTQIDEMNAFLAKYRSRFTAMMQAASDPKLKDFQVLSPFTL